MLFELNFTLDDRSHSLSNSLPVMEHKVYDISHTAWEFSTLIKNLNFTRKMVQIKSLVVVLKNRKLELSLILAKLFSCSLKEKCFSHLWEMSATCSVFKNMGNACLHLNIDLSASLVSSANPLDYNQQEGC